MTKARAAFFIGMLIYAVANIFNIRDVAVVQIPALALGAYVLYSSRKIDPLHLLPILFVLDGLWALIACALIFFRAITVNLRLWARSGLFILIPAAALLVQVLFVGGDLKYNIARYASILTPISLLFLLAGRSVSVNITQKTDLIVIFSLTVVLSIVCKSMHYPQERLSIFNGTENIAFVIISILFITIQSRLASIGGSVLAAILYISYLHTLNSRTAAVLGILIIAYAVGHRVNKAVLTLSSLAPIYLAYNYFSSSNDMGAAFTQLRFVLENVGSGDLLSLLSMIDIRGALYAEAISLVLASPVFGHGAVQPSLFSIAIYGLQEFHNGALDLLVTFGFFGTFCYVLMVAASISALKRKDTHFWVAVLIFLISSMLQPVIFNIQAMLIFAVALVLIAGPRHEESSGHTT